MKRHSTLITRILIATSAAALLAGQASAVRPSAQIVKDQGDGKYYYIYNFPGTNYGTLGKKYIGNSDVLAYYINALGISRVPQAPSSELANYPTYNWTLNFPCGTVIGNRSNGRLYTTDGYGLRTWYLRPDLDPGSPNPAGYSDSGFSTYIQALNNPLLKSYASRIVYTGSIPNPDETALYSGIDTLSTTTPLPCTIVHQTGTSDYYRIVARSIAGINVSTPPNWQKEPIGNNELLNIWLKYNNYVQVTTDISSMGQYATAATLPAGLLVRSTSNSQLYVTDDEGFKIAIPSMNTFYGLGYNLGSVHYVSQETLNSTPTVSRSL